MLCVWSVRLARAQYRLSAHEFNAINTCLRAGWHEDPHMSGGGGGGYSVIMVYQLQEALNPSGNLCNVTAFLESPDVEAYGWRCTLSAKDHASYRCVPIVPPQSKV